MSGSIYDVLNTPKYENKQKSLTDYIKLETDIPVKIQLLPKKAEAVNIHWINRMSYRCLGNECPVCSRNEAIGWDKEHKDFIRRDTNYITNVVDLTPSKVCPKCSYINAKNAVKCTNEGCNEMLVDVEVQPMNKVRYLEASYTLSKKIEMSIEDALVNLGLWEKKEDDDHPPIEQMCSFPVGLKKFNTAGDKTDYSVIPFSGEINKLNIDEYTEFFNAKDTGVKLTPDEMMMAMNGVGFRDILKTRTKTEENKKNELEEMFGPK